MKLALVKPTTETEKKTRTVVDTVMVTPAILAKWKSPPFQRPVRENDKVKALAIQLKSDGGVWPGIVTLGVLSGDVFIIDGQHRKAAFLISGLPEGYTDVRTHYFSTMAEMGREFVNLNSQLVRLRPDDIMRGLESSLPSIQYIREQCPFVGYDMIRRGEKSPLLSMSMTLRCWRGSSTDVPASNASGLSSAALAENMVEEEYRALVDFLGVAVSGFGRDAEYQRLWGGLNLTLCMWIYRRLVMTQYSPKTTRLTREQFRKCLLSLSAESCYLDWLVGRSLGDRDRAPAYNRIKMAFAARILTETGKKAIFPQPAWVHG